MPIDTRQLKVKWETFQKNAALEVLVPHSDHAAPSDIVSLNSTETNRLPSRQYLLFDEIAQLQVVLRSEQALQLVEEWLPYLELTITAHATNASTDGTNNVNPATTKHDIGVSKAHGTGNAALQTVGRATTVVWATSVSLARPRSRLQRPTIYFTALLGLSSSTLETLSKTEPVYAPSYEPLPANVLEPLRFAPGLVGSEIFLSEQRITKVAPIIQQHDNAPKSLRGASKRAFPAMAVLFPQLRCASFSDTSMADLHIEASDLLACKVLIEHAEIKIVGHTVDRLESIALPQLMQPGDQLAMLFHLKTTTEAGSRPTQKDDLLTAHITIRAKALLDVDNRAELVIRWQVPIDTTQADTTFRHIWSESAKELAEKHNDGGDTAQRSVPTREEAPGGHDAITFNFAASRTVAVSKAFTMQVQCINRSARSRSFAILPHRDTSNVLIQTPQVKLGPVAAGACFEADITFVAERAGVLDFGGGFRIVDLDTNRAIYIEDVPDVIAIEPDAQD